jgi:hypothetical protein
MSSFLRYAAVALCVALAFTACSKSTESTTTADATQTAAPDATATGGASTAPDAGTATAAPAASATTGAMTAATAVPSTTVATTTGGSTNDSSAGYIDLPVYPAANESKDQDMSMSANGGSFVIKAYTSKDDAKKVADWYKSQLPTAWKGGVMTAGNKTVGTFSNEMADGDQSVIVSSQDDGTTRIQLATKHGK